MNSPLLQDPLIRGLVDDGTTGQVLKPAQIEAIRALKAAVQKGELRMEPRGCVCGKLGPGKLVAGRDRYGLSVQTYLCECGILYSSPRLDESSLALFYRDYYRPMYMGEAKASDQFFEKQTRIGVGILTRLKAHLPAKGTIYDVGCGAGGTLVAFSQAGWTVRGCDFGRDFLEKGRSHGLDLVEGDAGTLATYGPADVLMANHVLEHTHDPKATLQLWASLVKDGGIVYLEVPGALRMFEKFRPVARYFHLGHTFHFTLHSLANLASECGLELVEGHERVWAIFRKTGQPKPGTYPGVAAQVEAYIQRSQRPTAALRRKLARIARQTLKRPEG